MRDSAPFLTSGSLPQLLQAFYLRFFREFFLGFTTRVHYFDSCMKRGAKHVGRGARHIKQGAGCMGHGALYGLLTAAFPLLA